MSLSPICGVYLIVSPSGGRYVGSSKSLKKRFNRYKNYSCSRQSAILASLKKYGYENHTLKVLYHCPSEELLFWERIFGDLYLASANFSNGLNVTLPSYADVPQVRSAEFRKRVSEIQKNRFSDPLQRKKTSEATRKGFTDEVRKEMSALHKKRFENPELRKQRSEVRKAYYRNNSDAVGKASEAAKRVYVENPEKRQIAYATLKKYKEENPDAHSELMKRRHLENPTLGEEQSRKLKEFYINNPDRRQAASQKSREQFADPANHHASKKVIDTVTGEVFSCMRVAAEKINVCPQTLRNWLTGFSKNKSSFKLAE